jgi:hypothetical protein
MDSTKASRCGSKTVVGSTMPGLFVGDNESAVWFGGGPSAYVVHPEAHQAEVVSIYRITPRDE